MTQQGENDMPTSFRVPLLSVDVRTDVWLTLRHDSRSSPPRRPHRVNGTRFSPSATPSLQPGRPKPAGRIDPQRMDPTRAAAAALVRTQPPWRSIRLA
jgi:hypothetical protein